MTQWSFLDESERPSSFRRRLRALDRELLARESRPTRLLRDPAGGARWRDHRRKRKLLDYIAAGGVQTGRPIRHERRVQDRRRLVLLGALCMVLVWVVFRHVG